LAALLLVASSIPFLAQQPQPATPSRIVLGWSADPATSQAVTWRTVDSVADPRAQIANAPPGPAIEKSATTVAARATRVELPGGGTVFHYLAQFEGLKPATRYVYRVGDGKTWSEWFAFVTASRNPAPFRFIYLGDAQNGLNDTWPRTVRAAYASAPDARLLVHAGDLVGEGYDDRLLGQWVAGFGFIAATVPSLPAPGNHDEHRAPSSSDASKAMEVPAVWRAHFALPANGPKLPGLEGQNYSLDYQGVRFIAVDANPFANDAYVETARANVQQTILAWLDTLLAHNPNRWTIVVQHQPLYSIAKGRDYPEMRAALGGLYDRYHVDLVLQGHDHAYARTHKVNGGRVVRSDEPGTIYTISVAGSKMYETATVHEKLLATIISNVQLYQVIAVEGDRLTYQSFTADGHQADAFQLMKTAAGSEYRTGSITAPLLPSGGQ
jgi:3',5'-cyclic AMP phosphodiesterase CpdA